jgi:cell division protein FtsB
MSRVLTFPFRGTKNVSGPAEGEPRHGEDHGLRKRAALLASIIVVIALVVGSFFGDRGILNLRSARTRTQVLAHEVEDLRADNAHLSAQIHALRTDPRAVERLAREELGLARADEVVFVLRSPTPAARP